MRKGFIAAGLAALAATAVVTAAVAKPVAQATPAQIAACTNVSVAFLGPLTGPAAFLGQEQISWMRFGVQKYNRANGTRFKVVPGDTQSRRPSPGPWLVGSSATATSWRWSEAPRARPCE
jgi:ABC-type branched-subunit amino acid transport system substrate-binding protein